MKKFSIALFVLFLSLSFANAQKHFVNLLAGYSTLSPSAENGYFIHADYTTRYLGIFRLGLGLGSNSFMEANNGYMSHEDALDLDAKIGLSIKLIGFRLEGGIGTFGRYWNRSYATDASTYHSFSVQGQNVSLNPGQISTYSYFSFGGFSYLSVGIEVNNWLGLKLYTQFKRDKFGEEMFNLGGGLYFLVNKK